MAMTQKQYKLALEITANARRAKMTVADLEKSVALMNVKSKSSGNIFAKGFSRASIYAGSLSRKISGIYSISKKVLSPFVTGFSTAFSWVSKISSALLKLPLKGLKWGAMGLGAVAGGMYLGHKALQPAAKVQRYEEQFRVQGTPEMLPWLKQMALKTTNTLDELIQSTILMQNFKIDPKKYLTPIMDLSNMFNKPLEEIVRSLGMLKSERYGEALESLARSGITRNDLKTLGIEFRSSGEVSDKSKDKVFETVIGLIRKRYGGASERRALTYEGQTSMLSDAVFNSLSEGLRGFLPHATTIVQTIRDWVLNAGEALKTVDWDSIGNRVVGYFQDAKNIADKMLTGEGRKDLWKHTKGLGKSLTEGLVPALITDFTLNIKGIAQWTMDNFGTWWDSIMSSKIMNSFVEGGKEAYYALKHGKSAKEFEMDLVQASLKDWQKAKKTGYYMPNEELKKADMPYGLGWTKKLGSLNPAVFLAAELGVSEEKAKSNIDYLRSRAAQITKQIALERSNKFKLSSLNTSMPNTHIWAYGKDVDDGKGGKKHIPGAFEKAHEELKSITRPMYGKGGNIAPDWEKRKEAYLPYTSYSPQIKSMIKQVYAFSGMEPLMASRGKINNHPVELTKSDFNLNRTSFGNIADRLTGKKEEYGPRKSDTESLGKEVTAPIVKKLNELMERFEKAINQAINSENNIIKIDVPPGVI